MQGGYIVSYVYIGGARRRRPRGLVLVIVSCMEPLEAISSVLTDLHYTEEEVEAVVTDLAGLLYRSTEQWTQVMIHSPGMPAGPSSSLRFCTLLFSSVGKSSPAGWQRLFLASSAHPPVSPSYQRQLGVLPSLATTAMKPVVSSPVWTPSPYSSPSVTLVTRGSGRGGRSKCLCTSRLWSPSAS